MQKNNNNNRGFAIALDALMAIILVTTLLVFLSQQPDFSFPSINNTQNLKRMSGNAFTALERSGTLSNLLAEQAFTANSAENVYEKAKALLPETTGLAVRIQGFDALINESDSGAGNCRASQDIASCFQPFQGTSVSSSSSYSGIPADRDVVYGKRVLQIERPWSDETIQNQIVCTPVESGFFSVPASQQLHQAKTEKKAFFGANDPPLLEYEIYLFSNQIRCTDSTLPGPPLPQVPNPALTPPPYSPGNESDYSQVHIRTRNQTRNPADVFLVMDNSGSMTTYDMNLDPTANKSGLFGGGTCENGACRKTETGVLTNCGQASMASSCGDPQSDYYTNKFVIKEEWDLNQEVYNLMAGGGNPLLYFIQLPHATGLGECSKCSGVPMPGISAKRTFPTPINSNYWYSGNSGMTQFYKNGTSQQPALDPTGDQFKVWGWNDQTDGTQGIWKSPYCPNGDCHGAFSYVAVQGSYLKETTYPTIPKSEDVDTCQYNFLGSCTPGQPVCGDYKLLQTIRIPDEIPNSASRWMTATFVLNFSPLVSGCDPKLMEIFVPPAGGNGTIREMGSYCPNARGPGTTAYCAGGLPGSKAWYVWNDNNLSNLPDTLLEGTHYIYVANDENITNPKSDIEYWLRIDTLTQPTPYNGGTCNGGACVYTSGTPANCPGYDGSGYGGSGFDHFYKPLDGTHTATDPMVLATFTPDQNQYLRGMQVKIQYPNSNPNTCPRPVYGLQRPNDDNSNLHGITYDFGQKLYNVNSGGYVYGYQIQLNNTVPLPQGAYKAWGWLDGPATNLYNVTWLESRVDSAQQAATRFIRNDNWKSEDRIGLVSYSDESQGVRDLLLLTDENKASLRDGLSSLDPNGETNTAAGINKARTQMAGETGRAQFIVVLSDGLANLPSPETATQEAKDEATLAYNSGIRVYTVAFGREAIVWNAGHWECNDQLTQIAQAGGGKCYAANDPQELTDIYDQLAGLVQQTLNDTNIEMPLYAGTWINNPYCDLVDCPKGIKLRTYNSDSTYNEQDWPYQATEWYLAKGNETLFMSGVLINQVSNWWDLNFNVAVPCENDYCHHEPLVFPPSGTTITTATNSPYSLTISWPENSQENPQADENLQVMIRDLGINFVDGTIGSGTINLDFNLSNQGNRNIDFTSHRGPSCNTGSPGQVEVRFFKDKEEPPNFDDASSIGQYCAAIGTDNKIYVPLQGERFHSILTNTSGGYIYAVIDPSQGTAPIYECRENNWTKLYCWEEPESKFYVLEYWSWLN